MFESLVKKNKFIILFLFLFLNCIFVSPIMANPTVDDSDRFEVPITPASAKVQYPRGITFNDDGSKMYVTGTTSGGVVGIV
tara:strand:+ start:104 stop:346 length:243 start_codon:yes stop_codon:yes gene_type:complete